MHMAVVGIEHDDNSYGYELPIQEIASESENGCLWVLYLRIPANHNLKQIDMGMFRHLPGVVSVYEETSQLRFDNYKRLWLIKMVDSVST